MKNHSLGTPLKEFMAGCAGNFFLHQYILVATVPRQSSNDFYMYMVEFSGNNYWFISNRAADSGYNIAMIMVNAACPDGKNLYIL